MCIAKQFYAYYVEGTDGNNGAKAPSLGGAGGGIVEQQRVSQAYQLAASFSVAPNASTGPDYTPI